MKNTGEIKMINSADKAVPEGWKLVPIKPTKNMYDHGVMAKDVMFATGARLNTSYFPVGAIYEAMLSAAPQPAIPSTTGWKPIETAPRDGTVILIHWVNVLGKYRITKATYVSKHSINCCDWQWDNLDTAECDEDGEAFVPEGWFEVIDSDASEYGYFMLFENPTHWMPLPQPPTKGD